MAPATVNLQGGVAEISIAPTAGALPAAPDLLAMLRQIRALRPGVVMIGTGSPDGAAGGDPALAGAATCIGPAELHDFALVLSELEKMAMPTLAVVHGDCVGAGFQLALSCDLIVAARSSLFSFPETALGLPPSHVGIAQIADRIGPSRAIELAFLGTAFDAEEMERLNIVSRVVDDDRLVQEARALAHRLAAGPTLAYASIKSMLRAWRSGGVDAARCALPGLIEAFHGERAAMLAADLVG